MPPGAGGGIGFAPRTVAALRAVLFQHRDLGAIALVDRPIEGGLAFRHPGVRIGAAIEQQLDRVGALRLGRDGVHQRGSPVLRRRARAGVHIGPEVEPPGDPIGGLPRRRRAQEILGRRRGFREEKVGGGQVVASQANAPRRRRQRGRIQSSGHQKLYDVDIGGADGERQRRRSSSILRPEVCPAVEKQLQQVDRARIRGGHEQRRPVRLRARIDVGAMCDQQPDLVDVRHRPQQRGGASRAGPIRVGAVLEQDLHHPGVREHGGGHQRRDPVGIDGVGVGAGAKQPLGVTDGSPLDRLKERAA